MPTKADNDDGADPTADIKARNPGQTTLADRVDADDPHKVEKLSAMGDADLAEATE